MSKFLPILLAALLLTAGTALAIPFAPNVQNDIYTLAKGGLANGIPTADDHNDGVPDIYDAVNLLTGSAFGFNYNIDYKFLEPDYIWKQLDGSIAVIGLTAGNANTLNVYTDLGVGNVQTYVDGPYSGFGFLGNGTFGSPFPAATIALPTGSTFGWNLDSSGTDFFSEVALNPDLPSMDHMMTFAMSEMAGQSVYIDLGGGPVQHTFINPYLITWEDLVCGGGSDDDFDDIMYLVDRVAPVPEPASLLLLGSGLVGLAVVFRSRRRR